MFTTSYDTHTHYDRQNKTQSGTKKYKITQNTNHNYQSIV